MKYIINPDLSQEDVKMIQDSLKENNGYCPCSLSKNPDTKCICKNFREGNHKECHCGLYIKVEEEA